jgi:hypothetical protein
MFNIENVNSRINYKAKTITNSLKYNNKDKNTRMFIGLVCNLRAFRNDGFPLDNFRPATGFDDFFYNKP